MPDATIAELPSAGSVNGTDLIPVFRDGQTFAATVSEIQVANTTPTYVVMGSEASLPNERVLTAGTGITVVDNGAGSTAVIEIGTNPVIPGSARLRLPAGTTVQRSGGSFGDLRANSDLVALEWFDGAGWSSLASATTVYVSSVGLSLPAELTVTGSPVTTSGTLSATWASAAQNSVFAGPSGGSGTPSFRALVAGDIPSLPYLSTSLSSAYVFVGNGSGVATGVALSGDATIANTGALTLATVNSSVGTYNTLTVNAKGLVTAGSNTAYLTANQSITLSGDVGGTGATAITATIASNAVTYAKFQQVAAVSLVGNATAGLANATGITLGTSLAFSGSSVGIATNGVSVGMLAQAAGSTIRGNVSTSTANVADLTDAQAATVLARYLELAPRWYS